MVWFYVILMVLMFVAISRMWRERRGVIMERRDPEFDPTEGHPKAAEAFDHLTQGNWGQLTALYWKLPASDRSHLVQGLGEVAAKAPINWPADADSAITTIRAGLQISRALKAIAEAVKRKISRTAFAAEMQGLVEARSLLVDAAARNPRDTVNLALQIRAEMLTSGDPSVLNNLLGRIDAAEEPNLFAALAHMDFVSPSGRGSIEAMWQAANEYASQPPNAAWLAIAAWAHIEEWRYSMSVNHNLTADYVARLQDDGFVEHIRKLDRDFWRMADRTEMTRAEAHVAHNILAFLLRIVRANDLAAAHIERIGPYIAAEPWGYLPEGAERPTRLLTQIRRESGLKDLATA